MVTLALGTTAPVSSVTVPETLPFETEVWANATEHISSADRAINANSVNRAPTRGELRFNMLGLPFGLTKFAGAVLENPGLCARHMRFCNAFGWPRSSWLQEGTTRVVKSGMNLQKRSTDGRNSRNGEEHWTDCWDAGIYQKRELCDGCLPKSG